MKSTETNLSITAAANGYIINKSVTTEGEKEDGSYFNEYTSETFVFTDWDEAIEWLKTNGK